jgi:hypothetical protein
MSSAIIPSGSAVCRKKARKEVIRRKYGIIGPKKIDLFSEAQSYNQYENDKTKQPHPLKGGYQK